MKNKTKIKLCEMLGAKQFRKIVLLIEKIKYKIIDKYFPNITDWYIKNNNKYIINELKKCNNNHEKELIIKKYQKEILLFKKEIKEKQNRNYHIDINHPTKILMYIKNNKKIHINSLIVNLILLCINLIFLSNYTTIFNIINLIEIISIIINLECINLQNYHLYKIKEKTTYEKIQKIEEKQNDKNLKKYKNASIVINKAFKKTQNIPTIDDIINEIKTKEEAIELLKYAKSKLKTNNIKQKILKKEGD